MLDSLKKLFMCKLKGINFFDYTLQAKFSLFFLVVNTLTIYRQFHQRFLYKSLF